MLKLKDVVNVIEKFAPLENQAGYDNSGLFYGDLSWEYKGALVTLDTSVEVVKEAKEKGANIIIEHHPSVFAPIKKIDLAIPKHRAIAEAIKNDIAIYSAHTTIDFTDGGLNDRVMQLIGCVESVPLNDEIDNMRIGCLTKPTSLLDLSNSIANTFNDKHVAFVGDANKVIKKVAVINGGGGSREGEVISAYYAGADVFISGDFKYNVLRLAKDLGFSIIVFGHYNSESPFMELIKELLNNENIGNVHLSTTCTDPLN